MRTSTEITFAVWKALFLREAVFRISKGRAAWFWLLLEPLFHVAYLMVLFSVIRMRTVGGISTALWIMVGLLAFFMFKRTATQAMNAVGANEALFAYRQVRPVDAVLVRAALEGFLTTLITVLGLSVAGLFGLAVVPAFPLMVMEAFFGMWLLGLGFGLITSVASELAPEFGNFIGLALTPVYFISGVIFPVGSVPPPYRDWLLLNPLVHGLEAARLGFAPYYHAVNELNIYYVYGTALVTIFLGLVLHNRFEMKLVTQ